MTTGYILIAAILILGGVIATVGDRIGTRVGKARLRLFKLRPRKTAVLVTILTGSLIAASTLAILFAADKRLRTGVFELERIQRDLRHQRQQLVSTRQQLETTTTQKSQVERELAQARAEQKAEQIEAQKRQAEAHKRLVATNQSLQAAIAKQSQTQAQLTRTQAQLLMVSTQFQQAQALLTKVSQQARALRSEIRQLRAERQQLIEQRNQVKARIAQRDREIAKLDKKIAQRDRGIAQRDKVIAQRENRLNKLETQQENLEREVARLEQYYQSYQILRRGNVALHRGQVLSAAVIRIVGYLAARQAVEELLQEANRTAIEFTQPGTTQMNRQVVEIPQAQFAQLIKQIDNGQDYVVQIISAGNYLLGEKRVQVLASATRNQMVFRAGDIVAATSVNPATMTDEEIQQRLNLLLFAYKFRARSAGIVRDTIQMGDDPTKSMISFIEQLKQYNQAVDIKAVAAEDTYTAGPLKVELVAVQNGKVVFRT
jgi:uncharacterized protein (DUF3084 family)